jgi:two-component system NtrC family sensor kinase
MFRIMPIGLRPGSSAEREGVEVLKADSEIAPKALNDLGQLSSAVGHNVINAFSAIVSNAELLRINLASGAIPIDPAVIADTIIDTAMEASSVARRLIDFTRPITSIGKERVALDQLVADYVETNRQTKSNGLIWSTAIEPIPPIFGQAGQLEAMLDLLVTNAREARDGDSPLEIRFATLIDNRGWVTLEIRDTGRGMTPETLQRAVEPFYSTKSGHLGVGLSIANGIWRRHRGTLSLRSHPEGGVILRFCVEPSEK